MIVACPIEKVTLTTSDIKNVFENALQNRMVKDKGKAKFLQCSQNIKLIGTANQSTQTYKLKQIYINHETLLDENTGEPIDPYRTFTCAMDSYIGSGGQNYSVLKNYNKERYVKDGI